MSNTYCIKIPTSKADKLSEQNKSFCGPSDQSSSVIYEDLIAIADDVFGGSKWSHAVTSQTVDFVEYVMGKYQIGCAAFVRVELPDGTFHEEMGYSNEESSVKGSAISLARTLSITNGLKKALLCFGGAIEKKIVEYASNNKKRKISQIDDKENQNDKIDSALKSSKSPTLVKSEQLELLKGNRSATNEFAMKKEAPEAKAISNCGQPQSQPGILVIKNTDESATIRLMTKEELRNERIRKQREKQEEYRRLMKDKESKF